MGTYRVNALVNQSSLDECSVIAVGDMVLPYFSSSVAGDPDLANLVVYLEDSGGMPVGNRVRYSTDPLAEPAGNVPGQENPADEPGDIEPAETAGAGETDETTDSMETGTTKITKTDDTKVADRGVKAPVVVEDLLIPVNNFSARLPPFPIPEDIEIGHYTLVFEIRGKQELLSRAERPILYTGDREFTSGGIHYYLPGLYGSKHLVPPGLTVMLETQVNYGEGLEPYIVWYNGTRKIGEGYVSGGAGRLLWKAGQQTGFHTIRAELFPFKPQSSRSQNPIKGIAKELSLPVSAEIEGTPAIKSGDFLYYYHLTGDLRETGTGTDLRHAEKTTPLWYPIEQSYGLALHKGDSYEASQTTLDLSALSSGTGLLRFFIRFSPLSEGTIMSALLGKGADPIAIRFFLKENALYLELERGEEKALSDPLELKGTRGSFMGVVLDAEIRETALRVSLTPADSLSSAGILPSVDVLSSVAALSSADSPPLADPRTLPQTGETAPSAETAASLWVAELELNSPLYGDLRSWLGQATEQGAPESRASPSKATAPIAVVDDFSALFRVFTRTTNGESPPQEAPAGEAADEIEAD
jgi:hypothetical protein